MRGVGRRDQSSGPNVLNSNNGYEVKLRFITLENLYYPNYKITLHYLKKEPS